MTSSSNSTNKGAAVDMLRKHMEKRSLDVKFDLEGTKYTPIENIGIGAYGVVCSAIHKKSKDRVAIKKIPSVFDVVVIAKRTYREIKILKHFKHDNIICIREILKPKEEYKDFRDIYVVFDLMESDLHKIIYSDQELSEEHSRYFLYQILRGLKYIHSANVVHRDLKPGNILVNEDCHVRIGDFGMSRGVFASPDEPSHFMTQYVATRWYRAPEILLSLIEYGTAVDMWSVGCIFAEMLGRKHLFPGKDYITQIKLIIGVLGSPSASVYKRCQTDLIKKMLKTIGFKEAIPWKTLFPKASANALDLLSKILVLNPAKRITVEEAMKHPYLSKYHDPDDEPICVPAFNFDFEKESMDKDKLRDVIYKEIMDFHKPKTPTLSFNAFIRPAPKVETFVPKPETIVKPIETNNTCPSKPQKPSPLIESNAGYQKQGEKQSPTKSVDISALQIPSTSDVEMLSAKCNDNKMMDVQSATFPRPASDKENRTVSDSKTISDDTKALVKAALLSCQRRQKLDSALDKEDKPKIVTAAMRQKEREDKRKNKKNKAMKLKKLKGVKERKSEEVVLSEADKEMLKRWSVMHKKVDQPIMPKPCNTPHDNVIIKQETSPPKTVHSTDIQSQSQSLDLDVGKPRNCIGNTIHNHGSDITEKDHNTNIIHLLPSTGQIYSQPYSTNSQISTTSNISGINSQLISNTYATSITDASMMAANNSTGIIDKAVDVVASLQVYHNPSTTNSNVILQNPNYQPIYQSSQSFPSTLHSSQITTFSNSPNTTFNTSDHSTLSFDSDSSFTSLNSDNMDLVALSKDLQSSMKSTVQPAVSQSIFVSTNKTESLTFTHPTSGATHVSNISFPYGQTPIASIPQPQKISVSADSDALTQQVSGFSHATNFPVQSDVGTDFSQQCFTHLHVSHQTPFYETTKSMGTVQPGLETHSVSHDHSNNASSDLQSNWQTDGQTSSNATPPYKSKVSDLKVNCSPKNQQSPPAGGHGQQDWIDFISKQMSKSGLENILPPALSLTPKGTGAGYGVGMVFDSPLVEAPDNNIQSPLSSSLLADWLEVSGGNFTLADLEDLEQEMSTQSPLPFNHLDIYPH